ncbi:MAG: trigger factor [Candidatus Aminicenantes bacterium RBG_19FT_COMBO_65_30]|nr:MAG: trigger factor [Candidatus Aminicenantes bacterium RBG_19FT_COMBO_65_30]
MNAPGRQSRLIDVSPSRKEIELEIPDEEVRQEYEKILGEYVAKAKLDGFRQGHAPRDRVKGLFDHDIKHDVYDSLIPRVLEDELRGLRLNPVNVPVLKDLKHEEGQPLRCAAAFDVLPEFELPDYRTIRVKKKTVEVAAADVDKALEGLRARAAEYVPVQGRGVQDGDYAVVEMQGRDQRTKRLLPIEKAVVLAGHAENEPALNEKIMGLTPGDERSFQVVYPKDHANRRVAGKDIVYGLKVREIKEKKLPALDDDFAKSLGTPEGLRDLREKVRKELLDARERAGRSETASEVLTGIADRVALELPESVVEQESLAALRRLLSAYHDRKIAPEALEGLKTEARRQAVDHLRNHLILEKIAQKEGFGVAEEEIQAEIHNLAQANNVSEAALGDMFRRDNHRREELVETLLFRKTVDFLVKTAIIG